MKDFLKMATEGNIYANYMVEMDLLWGGCQLVANDVPYLERGGIVINGVMIKHPSHYTELRILWSSH